MRLFEHANYKFIEKRRTLYMVSALLILVGIGGMIANVFAIGSWVAYGVDFTGGSLVQIQFQDPVDAADLRSALGGASAPPITQFGDAALHEFVIRAPLQENASIDQVASRVQDEIRSGLPGCCSAVRTGIWPAGRNGFFVKSNPTSRICLGRPGFY